MPGFNETSLTRHHPSGHARTHSHTPKHIFPSIYCPSKHLKGKFLSCTQSNTKRSIFLLKSFCHIFHQIYELSRESPCFFSFSVWVVPNIRVNEQEPLSLSYTPKHTNAHLHTHGCTHLLALPNKNCTRGKTD